MVWDPDQYLRFDSPRERPAAELLARINHPSPRSVLDLGCGPGNVTAMLTARWPSAAITALDNDPAMLARAEDAVPDVTVVEADIREYHPPHTFDVVYSNATLHWLDDHQILFPKLVGWLAPEGVLAVQMPVPDQQPSHLELLELASDPAWAERLLPSLRRGAVNPPSAYYDLLSGLTAEVDIWSVTYQQELFGPDPVTDWMKGAALRPLLPQLDAGEQAEFLRRYSDAAKRAYPRRPNGTTLLPYSRLFIVATAG